jgi:hypothetical protein
MPIGLAAVELSKNARLLLSYLNLRGGYLYACVALAPHLPTTHVVIPIPDFDWNPRVRTQRVKHPEVLDEMVRLGLMELKEFPVGGDLINRVYVLTQDGKRKGRQILQAR